MKSILVFRLSGYLATAVAHGWPDLCMWRSSNGPRSVWRIIAFAPCLPASCHWIGLSLFVGGGGLVADFGSGLGTFHLFPPTQLGLNSESELVIVHCTDNVYGLFDIMIW